MLDCVSSVLAADPLLLHLATPNTSHAPLPSTNAESRPPPVASTSASSNSAGPVSAQPTKATSPSKETPSKGASPRKGKDKAPPEAARDIDEEKPLATISTNGNGGLSIQVVGEWKRRFADVGAKVAVKEKTDLSDGTSLTFVTTTEAIETDLARPVLLRNSGLAPTGGDDPFLPGRDSRRERLRHAARAPRYEAKRSQWSGICGEMAAALL